MQGDVGEAQHTYKVVSLSHSTSSPAEFEFATRRVGLKIVGCTDIQVRESTAVAKLADALVICWTSRLARSLLGDTFGRYCVEIGDSLAVYRAITHQLKSAVEVKDGFAGKVQYRARLFLDAEPEPAPLGFVKPAKYADQEEVRMLWTLKNAEDLKPLVIYAPEVGRYCRLLD